MTLFYLRLLATEYLKEQLQVQQLISNSDESNQSIMILILFCSTKYGTSIF